jgi:polynucleotide 5'-hydroxyl-kinase GRC3/NOL9
MSLTVGEPFVVRAGRTKIIEASVESELDVTVGQTGKVDEVETSTIPQEWTDFIRKVAGMEPRNPRIMVLGGLDTGKNTLITYASNMLLKQGLKVALMDTDMGQGEMGPPTTISVAMLSEPISELLEMDPDSIFFVGSTSPMYLVGRVLQGTEKLMTFIKENAEEATLFVNMPGWVTGQAAAYFIKEMISRTGTGHLAVLQREDEVENILREIPSGIQVTRLPVSPYALQRSKDERKFLRETSYRKYLSHSGLIVARCGSIDFSPLFSSHGEEADSQVIRRVGDAVRSRVLYCEEGDNFINAIVTDYADANTEVLDEDSQEQGKPAQLNNTSGPPKQKEIRVVSLRELEYLMVALHGRGKTQVALGVLKRLDFRSRRATIVTPAEIHDIDILEVGKVRVSPQGYEIGHVEIRKILS